jgi:hypothetical protein
MMLLRPSPRAAVTSMRERVTSRSRRVTSSRGRRLRIIVGSDPSQIEMNSYNAEAGM